MTFAAILQTLITTKIGDRITSFKSNTNKEMVALAAANIAAGLLGGMPISAALIRTKCNIAEGANHRISAFINGVTLFIIAIACF